MDVSGGDDMVAIPSPTAHEWDRFVKDAFVHARGRVSEDSEDAGSGPDSFDQQSRTLSGDGCERTIAAAQQRLMAETVREKVNHRLEGRRRQRQAKRRSKGQRSHEEACLVSTRSSNEEIAAQKRPGRMPRNHGPRSTISVQVTWSAKRAGVVFGRCRGLVGLAKSYHAEYERRRDRQAPDNSLGQVLDAFSLQMTAVTFRRPMDLRTVSRGVWLSIVN